MPSTLPRGFVIYVSVIVAALALFIAVALSVSGANGLTAYDRDTARSLNEYGVLAPGLTSFFRVYTELGSKSFLLIVIGLVGIVLAWRKQAWFALFLFLFFLGGCGLNELLKELIARPRPEFVKIDSFSFPSGHSSGAMIGYGLLAYLALVKIERRNLAYTFACVFAFIALLVGYSRMHLTVHYFSDVLGSFLFSAAWLALSIVFLEMVRSRQRADEEDRARPVWNMAGERRGYQGSRPLY